MARKLFTIIFVLFVLCATALVANAQVLFTGTSNGKGLGSVYLFGTGSVLGGVHSANNWVGVVTGVTDRFDAVVGYGDQTTLGRHFPSATVGGFYALPTQRYGIDVAVLQTFSTSNAARRDTSSAFGNSVVIVSTPNAFFPNFSITPYMALNLNYSFGPKDRLLSYTATAKQGAIGVLVPIGKWGITGEGDFGKMKSLGIALSRSFKF